MTFQRINFSKFIFRVLIQVNHDIIAGCSHFRICTIFEIYHVVFTNGALAAAIHLQLPSTGLRQVIGNICNSRIPGQVNLRAVNAILHGILIACYRQAFALFGHVKPDFRRFVAVQRDRLACAIRCSRSQHETAVQIVGDVGDGRIDIADIRLVLLNSGVAGNGRVQLVLVHGQRQTAVVDGGSDIIVTLHYQIVVFIDDFLAIAAVLNRPLGRIVNRGAKLVIDSFQLGHVHSIGACAACGYARDLAGDVIGGVAYGDGVLGGFPGAGGIGGMIGTFGVIPDDTGGSVGHGFAAQRHGIGHGGFRPLSHGGGISGGVIDHAAQRCQAIFGAGNASVSHGRRIISAGYGPNSHGRGRNSGCCRSRSHGRGSFSASCRSNSHGRGINSAGCRSNSHGRGSFSTGCRSNSHGRGINSAGCRSRSHGRGSFSASCRFRSHGRGIISAGCRFRSHGRGIISAGCRLPSYGKGIIPAGIAASQGRGILSFGVGADTRSHSVLALGAVVVIVSAVGRAAVVGIDREIMSLRGFQLRHVYRVGVFFACGKIGNLSCRVSVTDRYSALHGFPCRRSFCGCFSCLGIITGHFRSGIRHRAFT